jgi:AsmA protein
MTKLLKILAVALLLLVAAALLAIALVDPNAFKDDIRARVEAATGRTLIIEGDLKLSVFPWLGLEIRGGRLANTPGFAIRPSPSRTGGAAGQADPASPPTTGGGPGAR